MLAGLLAAAGVTHVFGQPGGQTAAFYDGISRQPGLRHILVRDERSGAYAADAFARLTGRPGDLRRHRWDPGRRNSPTAWWRATTPRSPSSPWSASSRRTGHRCATRAWRRRASTRSAFLSAITKSALAVPSVAALPDLLRGAFRIATSGRPGPVALVIPHDVLDAEWAEGGLDVDDRTARAPAFRTVADPASVSEAAALLSAAARPLIVAGGGVHTSRAAAELAALAGGSTRWSSPASPGRGRSTRRRRTRPGC
jgi:acetolactate synthase-1/2/3 large subunit